MLYIPTDHYHALHDRAFLTRSKPALIFFYKERLLVHYCSCISLSSVSIENVPATVTCKVTVLSHVTC